MSVGNHLVFKNMSVIYANVFSMIYIYILKKMAIILIYELIIEVWIPSLLLLLLFFFILKHGYIT